jgi:mono/diheme cytochrome c family protein
MPRLTARERREAYQREYEFQKKTGKPFFPYAVFHDTITSLVVVGLIMGLAIIWHSGFGPAPTDAGGERSGGFLGPAYEAQADPGAEKYDPLPEWYFFFLFQLLRIFSTPELLLMGTIIIPTILMVLMLAWPFLDRGPERRVSRRPIAMTLGVAVPVVLLSLTWAGSASPPVGKAVVAPGVVVFTNNCGSCHVLAAAGTGGQLGPSLDAKKPDYALVVDRITNGKAVMPAVGKNAGWNEKQISCLAGFVATYAGGTGGSKGPNAASAKTYPADCDAAGADFAATK